MPIAQTMPRIAPKPAVGVVGFWKTASRKTAVSSPSRKTAKNAIPMRGLDRAFLQRAGRAVTQMARQPGGMPTHPDQHEGDDADGDGADDGLQTLLLLLRQLLVDDLQRDANG